MNVAENNIFANFISSIIIDKFELQATYNIFLTTFISAFLWKINDIDFITYFSMFSYFSLMNILYIFCAVIFLIFFLRRKEKSDYTYIQTFNNHSINALKFFIEKHPQFFTRSYNMIEDFPAVSLLWSIIPDFETNVYFSDQIHKVTGYFTSNFIEEEITENDKRTVKKKNIYIKLYIKNNSVYNAGEYLEKLAEYQEKIEENSDEMKLYFVKIFGVKEGKYPIVHRRLIYDGRKNNHEERYKNYMKTYFSEKREQLWEYLRTIHFSPEKFRQFGQEARCNLLLYGPPGSGKSTFAYRVAMSLGRHIFSIDISSLCENRYNVYKYIQSPEYHTDEPYESSKVVILLEEFDITVNYLIDRKKEPLFIKDEKTVKTEIKDFSEERPFELEDLLELLQGSVPLKEGIIIATTNKYEEIKNTCPALFRPGRLTAVNFSYMTWDSFEEMCLHFFGKKPTIPEKTIKIPTSEILEIAMNCSINNQSFEFFQEKIQKRMEEFLCF